MIAKLLWTVSVAVLLVTALASTTPSERDAMLQFVSTFQGCQDPSWTSTTPLCSWAGVSCDGNGEVTSFQWQRNSCEGTVDLTWLRYISSLQTLVLNTNQFNGSVDLTMLPTNMSSLDLSANQFSGTVDLSQLPANLQVLDLSTNQFDGTLGLTELPISLAEINLQGNQFCGCGQVNISCWEIDFPAQCSCSSHSFYDCGTC